MKKHIFGLAIFSFIVFVAAFVYGIFNVFNEHSGKAPKYETPLYIPEERTHCDLKRESDDLEIDSPNITQAVFNVKTKTLIWEFSASDTNKYPKLNLFLKDDKGVRRLDYLHSENCVRVKGPVSFVKKYSSLSNLAPKINLYLIPDTKEYSYADESNHSVEFDAAKAIPVTIDYGK